MSTDAPNPFVPDYDPVAEEIEQVAKAEYERGRLEGARIVRDHVRELVMQAADEGNLGGDMETVRAFLNRLPDDAQLQKLIEGEGK